MQGYDVKDIQEKRGTRFLNSLFQETKESNDVSPTKQPAQLSNELYVQIYIKAMISPDNIAFKATLHPQEEDDDIITDDVIENQELGMKKEFNVFVERDLVKKIDLLSKNYIEKQDLIKMPVCGASGIRLPEEEDFKLYFEFIKLASNQQKQTLLVQEQEHKTIFGLLICGCIFTDDHAQDVAYTELTKQPSIEVMFKLLLITVQYESKKYGPIVYQIIRNMLYLQAGLLNDSSDTLLNYIFNNKNGVSFEVVKPNYIKIKTKDHVLTINTTFLFPVNKQYLVSKDAYLKPLDVYSYFQVLRNSDIDDDFEMNEYPHIYQVKKEDTQLTYLIAIQQEAHGQIHLFKQMNDKYTVYSENYVGCIKRNLMGTSFKLVDDGYPKKLAHLFPDWVGSIKKELMKIEYETNIMASKPRKFDISYYNFENRTYENLVTLLPKYNAVKDCYQLHFYGRATVPSARNFQMIKAGDETTIYLLHGKMDRNIFNLDFRPPLNVMQAFTISMVSISSKFLVS